MFDFQKPTIEIAEISEDKRYGKIRMSNLWKEDMVQHLVIL